MGSIISSIYDDMQKQAFDRKTQILQEIAQSEFKRISETDVSGSEYDQLLWMLENREKILRNRKLIDLIG